MRAAREVMPAFRRSSSPRTASPATSSNATCTSPASASSTTPTRTSRRCRRASSSTRACSRPTSCSAFYARPPGRAARVRARARALALQHEHVPELAARAPVPDARPQRRDQHRAGQRELDARARRRDAAPTLLPGALERIFPICTPGASDTARFDEALELLNMAGRPLHHAILMMIPEAWENHESMDAARKAFYRYHASLMEPWDGPASIAFTDGTVIGAVLDRNGLRPSRYWVTDDDLVIMASEVGVLDVAAREGREEGPARAGQDLPRRHDAGPHHPRRRDQGRARGAAAVPGLARRGPRAPRRPAAAVPARAAAQLRGATAADVRLHAGRPAADHRADGAQRGRVARLDGHRHAGAGDLRPAPHALRVLQAAVRAGHEPAARRELRGAGHVAQLDDRARGQPARARTRRRAARSCARPRSSPTRSSRSSATSTTATARVDGLPAGRRLLALSRSPKAATACAWRSTTCARR